MQPAKPASGVNVPEEVSLAEPPELEAEESNELDGAETPSIPAAKVLGGFDVFISYRLDPDQPTAIALKRLVQGSIEPTPSVFVSGAGGLRPSAIGLKPQIQRAVTSARAFLAIITPHSKDREWIIFEAGAAWGRQQMYAPVLVDVEPHELGTTVADYVATKADRKEAMEALVAEIAKSLGGTLRSHFSQRHTAFDRHLQQRARKPADEKERNSSSGGGLSHALELWQRGERDEALAAFDKAESEASSVESKALVQILRLDALSGDDREKFRKTLHSLTEDVRATAVWLTWKGITERREHIAIADYERALTVPSARASDIDFAVEHRARGLFTLGRPEQAVALLMTFIRKVPEERRAGFAKLLWDESTSLSPMAKIALAAAVAPFDDSEVWRRLVELAIDERWAGLGIHSGRAYRSSSDSSSAKNSLGRIYLMAGFMSLAYEAFTEAAEAGATVAKVNLALCLKQQAVPAAGLALLKQHTGDWDCAPPDLPFRIRCEIEQAIAAERTRADQAAKRGQRLLLMLAELVDQGFDRGAVAGTLPAVVDENGVSVALRPLSPFEGVYEGRIANAFCGLFVRAEEGDGVFAGVRFDTDCKVEPEWVTLAPGNGDKSAANDPPAFAPQHVSGT